MTDQEFKRLKRPELLEILLAQSREIDALREKNQQLTRQLESRRIELSRAGSIAQAALELNGIFEKAQAAADMYLENVRQNAQQSAKTQQPEQKTQEAAKQAEPAQQEAAQQPKPAQQEAAKQQEAFGSAAAEGDAHETQSV